MTHDLLHILKQWRAGSISTDLARDRLSEVGVKHLGLDGETLCWRGRPWLRREPQGPRIVRGDAPPSGRAVDLRAALAELGDL